MVVFERSKETVIINVSSRKGRVECVASQAAMLLRLCIWFNCSWEQVPGADRAK